MSSRTKGTTERQLERLIEVISYEAPRGKLHMEHVRNIILQIFQSRGNDLEESPSRPGERLIEQRIRNSISHYDDRAKKEKMIWQYDRDSNVIHPRYTDTDWNNFLHLPDTDINVDLRDIIREDITDPIKTIRDIISGIDFDAPIPRRKLKKKRSVTDLRSMAIACGSRTQKRNPPPSKGSYVRDVSIKSYVLKQANHVCEYCEEPSRLKYLDGTPVELDIHHVIPLHRQGSDTLFNVIAVHQDCHRLLDACYKHFADELQQKIADRENVDVEYVKHQSRTIS